MKNGGRSLGTDLLTEFHVHRFAVAADAVQHPRLDAAAAHGAGAQLTGAPLWREDRDHSQRTA